MNHPSMQIPMLLERHAKTFKLCMDEALKKKSPRFYYLMSLVDPEHTDAWIAQGVAVGSGECMSVAALELMEQGAPPADWLELLSEAYAQRAPYAYFAKALAIVRGVLKADSDSLHDLVIATMLLQVHEEVQALSPNGWDEVQRDCPKASMRHRGMELAALSGEINPTCYLKLGGTMVAAGDLVGVMTSFHHR